MADPDPDAPHSCLAVFLGEWYAEGTSYGGELQSPKRPHAGATPWRSIHTARWHAGNYFLVQDERANGPFHTLSVLGWDGEAGRYFARTFENHGFARDYTLSVDADTDPDAGDRGDGVTWTFTGEHERALHRFTADGRTQHIAWEWKPKDVWLPLCDRTATRID